MQYDIPENIYNIISHLRRAGFRALPVGGCVRDLLLGNMPNDWDIATSAAPHEILDTFSHLKAFEPGQNAARFGTIAVMTDNVRVEVTTFRLDGRYTDGRRPDSVRFSRNLQDDLARRDFTINAMCLGEDSEIIDLFGGQRDLKAGVIRAIGVPDCRFKEDALRILRALRFAATLGFVIEPQTKAAMLHNSSRLSSLSAERVRSELEKLLCAKDFANVMLQYRQIILAVLPELQESPKNAISHRGHGCDEYARAIRAAGVTPVSLPIRLAILFGTNRQLCSAELTDGVMRRLKFSNTVRKRVIFLVSHRDLPLNNLDRIAVKRLLSKHDADALKDLIEMQRGDIMTLQADVKQQLARLEKTESLFEDILSEQTVLGLKQLAVSGRELIELGIEPGPRLGEILETLLQAVIDETLPNEPEALREHAKRIFAK